MLRRTAGSQYLESNSRKTTGRCQPGCGWREPRLRDSSLALVDVWRRNSGELANSRWGAEVGPEGNLGRRRAARYAEEGRGGKRRQRDEYSGEARHRARAAQLRSGRTGDAGQFRWADCFLLLAPNWIEGRIKG